MKGKTMKDAKEKRELNELTSVETDEKESGENTMKVSELFELDQYLNDAIKEDDLVFNLHWWAVGICKRLVDVKDTHRAKVGKHADHTAYLAALKETQNPNEAGDLFPQYVKYSNEIFAEEIEFPIRPMKSKWLKRSSSSAGIARAIIRFDLLEDPENLEDLVFEDDVKKKKR